jgi:hypothetical protein
MELPQLNNTSFAKAEVEVENKMKQIKMQVKMLQQTVSCPEQC